MADRVQPVVGEAVRGRPWLHSLLDGTWLATALTDVPVGAWTAAFALDAVSAVTRLAGARSAADGALAVGIAGALPAALTDASDWRDLTGESVRIATLHGLLNSAGLALNLALSFGLGVRVNQTFDGAQPAQFTTVSDQGSAQLELGEMRRVTLDGTAVLIAHDQSGQLCAIANTCRYDFDRPELALNDHLIFSKGHVSPLLYSLHKAAGAISDKELLTFRKLGSRLEGHPTPWIPWVDVATSDGQPVAILARTIKGKGVAAVENRNGFHGQPPEDPDAAVRELGGRRDLVVAPTPPPRDAEPHRFETQDEAPAASWELGEKVATRRAFGAALAALGTSNGRIVALDGEVGNSTFAGLFGDAHPERSFEMYIAEQQLVAAAVGLQVRGWIPFVATFAAFFSRTYDFIRMAAVSRADIRLVGSHCGASIGEDGPSQMALEDIAALPAVQGSTVLYPSCANQTAKLVAAMVDRPGIVYLRTTRAATPALYGPEESFEVGGSRVLHRTDSDEVTLVAAGITLHEALAAADDLQHEGVRARVIDLYSVKPIDERTLIEAAQKTAAIVAVEEHHPEGGIGDAVLEVFADDPSRRGSSRSPCARCRRQARLRSCSSRPASTASPSPARREH